MPAYSYDDSDAGGRLLAPTKRKRHQVRIQGRLVLVRSVSAVNLPSSSTQTQTQTPAVPPLPSPGLHHDPGVGSVVGRQRQTKTSVRRRSYEGSPVDEDPGDADADTEEDEHETALRDRQRRGYGIGGAGNIRRPTEVVHFYSSNSRSDDGGRRRRWQWMSSLLTGLRGKKESEAGTGEGTS